LECASAISFEVFVEDDALEGSAFAERTLFDDFELTRKSDTREGDAISECALSYIRNVAVFTEYHTHEIATLSERHLRNALKFGTSSEVDSQEGVTTAEGLEFAPPNCSEVGAPKGELDGAVGECLAKPLPQVSVRAKLIFDIEIDDPFLD